MYVCVHDCVCERVYAYVCLRMCAPCIGIVNLYVRVCVRVCVRACITACSRMSLRDKREPIWAPWLLAVAWHEYEH